MKLSVINSWFRVISMKFGAIIKQVPSDYNKLTNNNLYKGIMSVFAEYKGVIAHHHTKEEDLLIKKVLKPSLTLQQHEALLRNLDPHHFRRNLIEKNYRKLLSGFRGEKQLNYELTFLRNHKFTIYNDLRLPHQGNFFQIDCLLLSPTLILLLEAKNLSGRITINHHTNEMSRIVPATNEEEGYADPTLQTARHRLQLYEWLIKNNLRTISIDSLVVFTNPNSNLSISNGHPSGKSIIKGPATAQSVSQLQKKHEKNGPVTTHELSNISSRLLADHTPKKEDILQRYNIRASEITTGIACPDCSQRPMIRVRGKWKCINTVCLKTSNDAHLTALKDYALMFGPRITNTSARHYLNIKSSSITQKLLAEMNLPSNGTTRNYSYELPIEN